MLNKRQREMMENGNGVSGVLVIGATKDVERNHFLLKGERETKSVSLYVNKNFSFYCRELHFQEVVLVLL